MTNTVAETVRVSATLDGAAITDTADVVFTSGEADVATSTVMATSPVVADGVSTSQVTVRLRDARGNALGASGGTVVVSASGSAQASGVTDNRDGTYSATVTNTVAETVRVSATLDGAAITDTADVVFTSGEADVATSTVMATSPVVADGVSTSQVTVRLRDARGNALGRQWRHGGGFGERLGAGFRSDRQSRRHLFGHGDQHGCANGEGVGNAGRRGNHGYGGCGVHVRAKRMSPPRR